MTDDYARAHEALQPLGLAPRFEQQFADFAEALAPAAWAVRLLEHHEAVQRAKPPDGKAPWVERFDDGGYVVRPPYRRDEPVAISDEYVHAYRTRPLWSFALELGVMLDAGRIVAAAAYLLITLVGGLAAVHVALWFRGRLAGTPTGEGRHP